MTLLKTGVMAAELGSSGSHPSKIAKGGAARIKQPHVSALMRNRAGSFSVERLMEFLTALGQDVEISVRPAKGQGEVSVVV